MYEVHIAHSIGTFSEIGIVASVALLFDAIPLQEDMKCDLLIATESQRITQASFHDKANDFPPSISIGIHSGLIIRDIFIRYWIKFLLGITKIVPFASVVLGVWALFGIAFYPSIPSSMRV